MRELLSSGKKRGFVSSLLAGMFFALLLELALFQSAQSFSFSIAKKAVYTWDDVREDLLMLTGLHVVKEEENLTMYDNIPPHFPVAQSLQAYNNFIQDYYKEKNWEIRILDSGGTPITDFNCFAKQNCEEDKVVFTIKPFNITYEYPDWSKNQLDIVCKTSSSPPCSFNSVQRINLSFNLSSINFSCTPSIWDNCTNADFDWGQRDKVFGSGACSGGEPCLLKPYNLSIIDSQNKVYSCPGVYNDGNPANEKQANCPETVWNWPDSSTATLTIRSSPCWVKLEFGDGGHFLIRGTQPNSDSDCSFALDSVVNLQFNTTDYVVDVPSLLRVRDLGWNESKTQKI
ncbi:MAG: hypothetical protein V1717_00545 [Candidatus Micrarchaeota archaeon]